MVTRCCRTSSSLRSSRKPGTTMPIDIQDALQRTIEHREIFHDEMLSLMRKIMNGEASPVMIAAFTVGLRVKKETVGEIAAAAQVMREFATKVEVPDRDHLLDIVGTGGDAAHTFNIHGPMTNPAGAPNQLLGVFHPDLVGILVRVLQRLESKHVLVVYGKDGMDEVSLGAATLVGELKDGQVREYEIHPEDFGLRMISNRGLRVGDAQESKAMLLEALANIEGTPREIVVL